MRRKVAHRIASCLLRRVAQTFHWTSQSSRFRDAARSGSYRVVVVAPRMLRATCALACALALALGVTGCGDDDSDSGRDETQSSADQSTASPSDEGSESPLESDGTAAAGPLHECAELWNAADLDEVRSIFSAQHRQDSAEAGEPDVVVGHYQGERFVLSAYYKEVTVPDGACVVVDVDGTTVSAEPQYGGYAAALVGGEWSSAVAADHPLAEYPLPITDPQLVKLDGGFEDPVLALP